MIRIDNDDDDDDEGKTSSTNNDFYQPQIKLKKKNNIGSFLSVDNNN